jgi:hypothetical protein
MSRTRGQSPIFAGNPLFIHVPPRNDCVCHRAGSTRRVNQGIVNEHIL